MEPPQSMEEEEAELRRAIEMSKIQFEEDKVLHFGVMSPNSSNNNILSPAAAGEDEEGEYFYELQSVVSHNGQSATSGHYLADVFRYDVGGWVRKAGCPSMCNV